VADRDVDIDIVAHDKTERATRSAERNFDGLKRNIGGLPKVASTAGNETESVFENVAQAISRSSIVAIGGIAVAIALLPGAAVAAASGVVLALGGGLAAVGLIAAAQSEKVKKVFTGLKDHVISEVKKISKPFEGVLLNLAATARRVFDSLSKPVAEAFAKIAPALDKFFTQLGNALLALTPSIKPVTDAFTKLLEKLGPKLPIIMDMVSDAIIVLAGVAADNAEEFALMVLGIAAAIKVAAYAVKAFSLLVGSAAVLGNAIRGIGPVFNKMKSIAGPAIRAVIVMFLDMVSKILDGAVRAFGWVPGIGPKLKAAQAAFAVFRAEVNRQLDAINDETVYLNVKVRAPSAKVLAGVAGGHQFFSDFRGGFAFAGDGGSSRTQSPTPVNIDNRVYLDGEVIRATARTIVNDEAKRQAWRARTGRR
jgi:phage-related protein